MKNNTQQIRALLEKNVLIKTSTKTLLLEKLERFDEAQIERLQALLLEAKKKQDQFLLQAIKNNPSFLKEAKEFVKKQFKQERENKETQSREEESFLLNELEDTLNNL